jgi:hypothetical protein
MASAQKAAAPDGADRGDDLVVDLLSAEPAMRALASSGDEPRANSAGPVGRPQRSGSRRTQVHGCRWCRIDAQAPGALDARAAVVTPLAERLDSTHIWVLRWPTGATKRQAIRR